MSYAERAYILHIDPNGTYHRIEIHQWDFVGESQRVEANMTSNLPRRSVDRIKPWEPDDNPIKHTNFELSLMIRDQNDVTLNILQDIFDSDDEEFLLVYKEGLTSNPAIEWKGLIDSGFLEVPEAPYPYSVTIKANDFERLKGITYTMQTGRSPIVKVLNDLLQEIPYQATIRSNTSWRNSNNNELQDFLQHIHMEKEALRNISTSPEEDDTPITCYEALQWILRNLRLYLIYRDGLFHIFHKSSFLDPLDVPFAVYDINGDVTSQSSGNGIQDDYTNLDITIRSVASVARGRRAIKTASVFFDHRSSLLNIVFPELIQLEDPNFSEIYSQYFQSDGNQKIRIEAEVEGYFGAAPSNAYVRVQILADDEYWTGSAWTTTPSFVEVDMDAFTLTSARVFLNVETDPVTNTGSILLQITVLNAIDDSGAADLTDWRQTDLTIINPIFGEGNSKGVLYELEQPEKRHLNIQYPAAFFGDGPRPDSVSALTYSSNENHLTGDDWGFIEETQNMVFFELYLREELEAFRSFRQTVDADIIGRISQRRILLYRGRNYIYAGGEQFITDGNWRNANLLQIDYEGEAVGDPDDFRVIYKFSEE